MSKRFDTSGMYPGKRNPGGSPTTGRTNNTPQGKAGETPVQVPARPGTVQNRGDRARESYAPPTRTRPTTKPNTTPAQTPASPKPAQTPQPKPAPTPEEVRRNNLNDMNEILGVNSYTGEAEDIAKEEWRRYGVDNAADYRAALKERGTGLGYLGRKFVGGAKSATQALANDFGYRSQLFEPSMDAEQAYWEDIYKGGAQSRAAREERYAGLTENQIAALEIMGGVDARSEYFLRQQREAEERYADAPLVRMADWGDAYNAQTYQKYGNVSGALGYAGNLAETLGSRVPAEIVRHLPGIGLFLSNAMLYSQTSGLAFDQALSHGATRREAERYASAIGTKNVLTERFSDGMGKLFGKGALDGVTNRVVDGLAKTDAGKTVLRFLMNANNEGMENVVDDVLNPLFETIYNGKQYSSAREYFSEMDVERLAEDYLTAFGESLIFQSGGELVERSRKPTDPIYAVLVDQAQEKAQETLDTEEYQHVIQGLSGGENIQTLGTEIGNKYGDAVENLPQANAFVNGNLYPLGSNPSIDRNVMTALKTGDIIDSQTGKYALVGSYRNLNRFRRQEGIAGTQTHHLNQQAAFEDHIPYQDGMCILLRGNVIAEKGSEHNLVHKGLESMFDRHRLGGELEGTPPTVGEYNMANAESMRRAGFGDGLTDAFMNVAMNEQQQYGLFQDDLIRLPGSMHLK